MADIDGSGAIQQIWMTPAPSTRLALHHPPLLLGRRDRAVGRGAVGDFFACGWGKYCPDQLAARLRQSGQRLQLLLDHALPQDAEITWRTSTTRTMVLYYQINYTLTEVPDGRGLLPRPVPPRRTRCPSRRIYTILDGVKGRGQYVGTYMAWEVRNAGWWGEGEIKFFLDGDKEFPTICGTGTEDYFCGSYGFANQRQVRTSSRTPYAGLPQVLPPDGQSADPAAVRALPLAHPGPDPLREGPAGDDPGPGLAVGRPVPAAGGRHRLGGLLVPGRAARGVPQTSGEERAGDYLTAPRRPCRPFWEGNFEERGHILKSPTICEQFR